MRAAKTGVFLVQIHRNRNKEIISSSSCSPLVRLRLEWNWNLAVGGRPVW